MTITERLLMRGKPKSDESFIGYLIRLTEQNHYDAPTWILGLAGAKHRLNCAHEVTFKTERWLGNLAALTGTEEDELKSLTFPLADENKGEPLHSFFGQSLHKYLIRPDRPKVCPDCLKEFGYCRAAWDIMLVTACPLHNKLLIDECPQCRRRLPYIRNRISHCSCNYDFRSAQASSLEDKDVGLARHLHRMCGASFTECDSLQQFNPLRTLQLVDLATAIVSLSIQLKGLFTLTGKKIVKSKNNAELHEGFTEVYKAFDGFPYNYYGLLEKLQRRDEVTPKEKGHKNGLGKWFGSFYEELRAQLAAPCFEFMHTSFSDYVGTLWGECNAVESRSSNDLADEKVPNYVTCNAAQRQLRVDELYIKHLVSARQLQAVTRQTPKKQMMLIDFDSLMQVKHEHEGSLSSIEVGRQLDVSKGVVEQLVSNGCLSSLYATEPNGFGRWKFKCDAAEQLLTAIRNKVTHSPNSQSEAELNLKSMWRKLSYWKIRISCFVKDILTGKIKPNSENPNRRGLHRFTFLASDIEEYVKSHLTAYVSKLRIKPKISLSNIQVTNFCEAPRKW